MSRWVGPSNHKDVQKISSDRQPLMWPERVERFNERQAAVQRITIHIVRELLRLGKVAEASRGATAG